MFTDRVVPRSVVTTSAHFHRAAHGLVPPNGVRVHVSGIDLVRDEAGDFRVLEDNLRSPSGVSYVITNRAAMSQVLPELFGDHRVQPVSDYPSRLLAALKASAPSGVSDHSASTSRMSRGRRSSQAAQSGPRDALARNFPPASVTS